MEEKILFSYPPTTLLLIVIDKILDLLEMQYMLWLDVLCRFSRKCWRRKNLLNQTTFLVPIIRNHHQKKVEKIVNLKEKSRHNCGINLISWARVIRKVQKSNLLNQFQSKTIEIKNCKSKLDGMNHFGLVIDLIRWKLTKA